MQYAVLLVVDQHSFECQLVLLEIDGGAKVVRRHWLSRRSYNCECWKECNHREKDAPKIDKVLGEMMYDQERISSIIANLVEEPVSLSPLFG